MIQTQAKFSEIMLFSHVFTQVGGMIFGRLGWKTSTNPSPSWIIANIPNKGTYSFTLFPSLFVFYLSSSIAK
jgi:hypothetical protein